MTVVGSSVDIGTVVPFDSPCFDCSCFAAAAAHDWLIIVLRHDKGALHRLEEQTTLDTGILSTEFRHGLI
jgi:hypothetical protein